MLLLPIGSLYIAGNSKIPIIDLSFLSNPRFPLTNPPVDKIEAEIRTKTVLSKKVVRLLRYIIVSSLFWVCCVQIMENRNWRPYRRSEEYQEEDVWNVIRDNRDVGIKIDEPRAPTSPLSISRRLPSAARMIPRSHKHENHDNDGRILVQQHSAPVSIPDWPKIYGKSPKRMDDSYHPNHYGNNYNVHVHGGDESDDDYVNDDAVNDPRLPPHEWLAKKYARSKTSSFSVCEGAGRTLKGKDLCKVRDAVLSKTGFL